MLSVTEVMVISVDRFSVGNMKTESLTLIDRIIFVQDVAKKTHHSSWCDITNKMKRNEMKDAVY